MRKFVVLPLLVLLAACADQTAVAPDGDMGLLAAKGGNGKGKGGGGGGGGDSELPADVAAITFVQRGDLVVMNADGTNQTVVYDAAYAATPSWSPDGNSIVVHTYHDGGDSIRTIGITVDGGGIQPGAVSASIHSCTPYSGPARVNCHPAWSPSATEIAIADGNTASGAGPSRIHLVKLDESPGTVIYTAPPGIACLPDDPEWLCNSDLRYPTWSPNGDRLAFVQASYGDPECTDGYPCIKIIDAPLDQGDPWPVTASVALDNTVVGTFQYIEALEWARTTDELIFSGATTSPTGSGIYTLDLANSQVSGPVIPDGQTPVWSHDDQWIAWVRSRNDQLMLHNVDSANDYKVASNAADPDWVRILQGN